jgi:hypothetical protein
MAQPFAITCQIRYYRTMPSSVELRSDGQKQARIDVTVRNPRRAVQAFDFTSWKDAPHVALANLRDEPEAVLRFTRTYGVLVPDYNGESITVPVRDVLRYRDELQDAWEGRTYFPLITSFETTVSVWPNVEGLRAGVGVVVKDLGKLIGIMFAQDLWEGRLKKCENPDCTSPYFRVVRKGQKYCSTKCAVLINVHRFREKEAAQKAKGGNHAKAKKA